MHPNRRFISAQLITFLLLSVFVCRAKGYIILVVEQAARDVRWVVSKSALPYQGPRYDNAVIYSIDFVTLDREFVRISIC